MTPPSHFFSPSQIQHTCALSHLTLSLTTHSLRSWLSPSRSFHHIFAWPLPLCFSTSHTYTTPAHAHTSRSHSRLTHKTADCHRVNLLHDTFTSPSRVSHSHSTLTHHSLTTHFLITQLIITESIFFTIFLHDFSLSVFPPHTHSPLTHHSLILSLITKLNRVDLLHDFFFCITLPLCFSPVSHTLSLTTHLSHSWLSPSQSSARPRLPCCLRPTRLRPRWDLHAHAYAFYELCCVFCVSASAHAYTFHKICCIKHLLAFHTRVKIFCIY